MSSPKRRIALAILAAVFICGSAGLKAEAQPRSGSQVNDDELVKVQNQRGGVRTVTIPITVRQKGERAAQQELTPIGMLTVREDGDDQKILSIRAMGLDTPITVAVLIQDDVVASISNEIATIKDFINHLPRESRVLIGYIRSGSLEVRQTFTADHERATKALRIPIGSAAAAPYNPYIEIIEGLRRFEATPKGRRALLVVSDGLDTSRGLDSSQPSQSVDLRRAIKEAQRQGVAVYSFYAPSVSIAASNNLRLITDGQGSLQKLADETGGRAFFQGTGTPVSFDSYLRDLAGAFSRQIALTYLSTHPNKGFHKIEITSDMKDIRIDHPSGYTR
jgi:VWFA-related protein